MRSIECLPVATGGTAVTLAAALSQVENHDHCVYDFVEVRDGHEDSSRLLGKYCGHRMPQDVKSTTNKMYVKFVSDASVQKGGFAAVFVKGQFRPAAAYSGSLAPALLHQYYC